MRFDKIRTYVIDEKRYINTIEFEKVFYDENHEFDEYYVDEIDQYWNSNYNELEDEFTMLFISLIVICRHCKKIFDFNNLLHEHLQIVHRIKRKERLLKFKISIYIVTRIDDKIDDALRKSFASKFFVMKSFAISITTIIKKDIIIVARISSK